MYLSRLLLNPRSRQVHRESGDPYQQHRTVMSAFPETLPEDERVLYRLDVQPRTGQMVLLVQSHTEPTWDGLAEKGYLLPEDPFSELRNPAVKVIDLAVQAGQILSFRLRANPTKRLMKDIPERNLKKGQRIALFEEPEQLEWLQKKAKNHGFAIGNVHIIDEGFKRGKTNDEQRLAFFAVRFEGHLQVTDPNALVQAVECGIGPAKAFGCGLLSLARAG
ncbi:MAG: type I-E CRISPR-associated protein Cas6/Cse3/CasE [Anaerolineae bacterium]|nr:type I-E CRISPR-associated protein Cas6/Cse3/CasE [Anaerolineae bacterium]